MRFLFSKYGRKQCYWRLKPIRALHFVLRNLTYDDAITYLIDPGAALGYNALVIQIADGLNSPAFPRPALASAWTVDQMRQLIKYANAKGLEVIPEVKLLTHQQRFFNTSHPNLMYNHETYDPSKQGTYDLVYPYIDELLDIFGDNAFHIGHDECIGYRDGQLQEGESMLPASLYSDSVSALRDYLRTNYGAIKILMWGDMLARPSEFPTMLDKHFHGEPAGYGAELRPNLPRDIIICDWRYNDDQVDFPIVDTYKDEGFFGVLGAPWKKLATVDNFSAYSANAGCNGMIATTWFHVQRKEWAIVNDILVKNANAFNAHFPDLTDSKVTNFLIEMPSGDHNLASPPRNSNYKIVVYGERPSNRLTESVIVNNKQITHILADVSLRNLETFIKYYDLSWAVLAAIDSNGNVSKAGNADTIASYLPNVTAAQLRGGYKLLNRYEGHPTWTFS